MVKIKQKRLGKIVDRLKIELHNLDASRQPKKAKAIENQINALESIRV